MLNPDPLDARPQRRRPAPGFVGRGLELDESRACVDEVRAGRPWVVLIEGGAGIGKTSLVAKIVSELHGFTVLRAYCAREETDLNYGLIDQLRATVPALSAGQRRFTQSAHLAQAPAPVQVGTDLLALLSELQSAGPVAVVIEDLQWSDRASAQALGFVVRRLFADQILTLLTARIDPDAPALGDEPDQDLFTAEARPGWGWLTAREPLLRIKLGGLDSTAVREFAQLFGIALSDHDVERLRVHTEGNPLYLATLLADATSATFAAQGPLPVPASLSAALNRQLASLPSSARALLDAVAVLDVRSPLNTFAALSGVQDPAVALDPLVAAGLVRWYPSDPVAPLEIPHPLQRDAVYAGISPPRRRELHGRAAAMVPHAASWGHRVAAADQADAELSAELEAEAHQLIRQAQSERAATFLIWAAELSDQRAEIERLTIAAAVMLFLNNHQARFQSLRSQIEDFPPSVGRTLIMGFAALSRGEFEPALRTLYETLAAAALPDAPPGAAELAAPAAQTISAGLLWIGENLEECRRLAELAGDLGRSDLQITLRAARNVPFSILLQHGPRAALADFAEHQRLPANPAEANGLDAHMLIMRGGCHVMAGDLGAAFADLNLGWRLAPASPVEYLEVDGHFWLSQAHLLAGNWREAKVHGERGAAAAQTEDVGWGHPQTQALWAMAAAGLGDWSTAEAAAATSEHWFALVGPPQYVVFPSVAAGAVTAARGDHAGTLAALEPLFTLRDRGHVRMWLIYWAPMLTEAQLATGRLGEAAETLSWIAELAADVALLRPAVAWFSGTLAEARGDSAAADRAYAAGLAIPPSPDDAPYYRARLEHAYARLLTTTGNPKTAAQLLRSAHARYTAMDARPYLERLNNDLAELRIPPPHTDTLAPLTDRERDVARLVADGLTNTETATRLYLSSKTIEYHLAHIYPKLGITSRRQLRDLMHAGHRPLRQPLVRPVPDREH